MEIKICDKETIHDIIPDNGINIGLVDLYPHQKNLCNYLLKLEQDYLFLHPKIIKFKENLESKISSLHTTFNNECNKFKTENSNLISGLFSHQLKIDFKLNYGYIVCLNDPLGYEREYSVLALIYKQPLEYNIIIVNHKLIGKWERYLKKLNLDYVILDKEIYRSDKLKKIILIPENFIYKLCLICDEIKIDRMFFDESAIRILDVKNYLYFAKFKYIIGGSKICYSELPLITNQSSCDILKHKVLHIRNVDLPKIIPPEYVSISSVITKSMFFDLPGNFENLLKTGKFLNSEFNGFENLIVDIFGYTKQKLFKIFNDIDYIYDKNDKSKLNSILKRLLRNDCPICLDEIKEKKIASCCLFSLCSYCSQNLIKCPYCRKKKENFPIKSIPIFYLGDLELSIKEKVVIIDVKKTIKDAEIKALNNKWFRYCKYFVIKNKRNSYDTIMSVFKYSKKHNLLYLTKQENIYGFDLGFVTDLIILDPKTEITVLDSFNCISRTKPLTIYK